MRPKKRVRTEGSRIENKAALEEKMPLVEKWRGGPLGVFPFGPGVLRGRILKALGFLAAFSLAFFTLGFAFGHGYWVFALWFAAAALAWIFVRGASEASLPPERSRDG